MAVSGIVMLLETATMPLVTAIDIASNPKEPVALAASLQRALALQPITIVSPRYQGFTRLLKQIS